MFLGMKVPKSSKFIISSGRSSSSIPLLTAFEKICNSNPSEIQYTKRWKKIVPRRCTKNHFLSESFPISCPYFVLGSWEVGKQFPKLVASHSTQDWHAAPEQLKLPKMTKTDHSQDPIGLKTDYSEAKTKAFQEKIFRTCPYFKKRVKVEVLLYLTKQSSSTHFGLLSARWRQDCCLPAWKQ